MGGRRPAAVVYGAGEKQGKGARALTEVAVPKPINLTGQRFGKLQVLERIGSDKRSQGSLFRCKCDCGRVTVVLGASLKRSNTNSCGCLKSAPHDAPRIDLVG
jgi:hypothetical protein